MLICHCHRVSGDDVTAVLDAGAAKVGQVVRATRAGSDCGGCIPLLRELCARRAAACALHEDKAALAG